MKRTPEEWDYEAREKLKEARNWASANSWRVVQSGKIYQVLDGGSVIYQHKSIWKVCGWCMDRIPYAYGSLVVDRSEKIRRHYDDLFVPTHEKDDFDYGLTSDEKSDLMRDFEKRLAESVGEIEALICLPYYFYHSIKDRQFVLADSDGDVLKESDSPWVVLDHYKTLTEKSQ
jgi:hypothetical protein